VYLKLNLDRLSYIYHDKKYQGKNTIELVSTIIITKSHVTILRNLYIEYTI